VVRAESVPTAGHWDLLRNRYQKFLPTIFAVNDCRKSVINHREPLSRYRGASLLSCIEFRMWQGVTNRPIGSFHADRADIGVAREWAPCSCPKGGGGAVPLAWRIVAPVDCGTPGRGGIDPCAILLLRERMDA